jgi:hypothetical protein
MKTRCAASKSVVGPFGNKNTATKCFYSHSLLCSYGKTTSLVYSMLEVSIYMER